MLIAKLKILKDSWICGLLFIQSDDSTEVNDKWIKEATDREKKSEIKPTGWNTRQLTCKGLVVYCDPKVPSVSLPLTEVYLSAVKLSKEKGNDNIKIYAYPANLLLCIYSILNSCVPGKQKIQKNVKILRTFLDEITDGSETNNDSIGEGISGFSKIMSTVMKAVGVNIPIDDKKMEETVREAFNSDTAKNMTKAVGKVMENINSKKSETGTDAIKNVVDGISSAWNDPEIKSMFAGGSETSGQPRTSVIDPMDCPSESTTSIHVTMPLISEGETGDQE